MKVSIKAMRVNANLRQKDAAGLIGVRRETLQSWEAGKTFPRASQLVRICEAYHCTIDDLFFASETNLK